MAKTSVSCGMHLKEMSRKPYFLCNFKLHYLWISFKMPWNDQIVLNIQTSKITSCSLVSLHLWWVSSFLLIESKQRWYLFHREGFLMGPIWEKKEESVASSIAWYKFATMFIYVYIDQHVLKPFWLLTIKKIVIWLYIMNTYIYAYNYSFVCLDRRRIRDNVCPAQLNRALSIRKTQEENRWCEQSICPLFPDGANVFKPFWEPIIEIEKLATIIVSVLHVSNTGNDNWCGINYWSLWICYVEIFLSITLAIHVVVTLTASTRTNVA